MAERRNVVQKKYTRRGASSRRIVQKISEMVFFVGGATQVVPQSTIDHPPPSPYTALPQIHASFSSSRHGDSFGTGFWLTERSSQKYPGDALGIVATHLLSVAALAIGWCAQAGRISPSFGIFHETVLPSSESLVVTYLAGACQWSI